ncbi:hypothetical protein HIM_03770 [Hirsutella minnesotensis 3608]|uniref:NmrA-like domain-containing protein n=1 Tax=Hirsutella minnesotensis 3608 TaxID=1043627 RepID=A0A0F7ZVM9_9HYPO|nr:hypothetical protein HIM_03770 [Hirsutella minnesotensis 3608]
MGAVFEAGVQLFMFRGLASAGPASQGKMLIKSSDEKYVTGEYAKCRGFKSAVIISAGIYMDEFTEKEFTRIIGGFPQITDDEGYRTLPLSMGAGRAGSPWFPSKMTLAIMCMVCCSNPEHYNSQLVQALSTLITPQETVVQVFERHTGQQARFIPVTDLQIVDTQGNLALENLKDNLRFLHCCDGRYFGVPSDVTQARLLKAQANQAKGFPEGHGLMSLAHWFDQYLSSRIAAH